MNFLKRTTANSLAQQAEQKAQEGHFDEALELAEKALAQDDKNALVWKIVTKIQFSIGDNVTAVKSMQRYLELAPDDAPAWSVLGSTLKEMGEFAEAEKAHLRATEVAPGEGTCWYNLGVLYEVTNLDAAQGAYLRALECDAQDAAAWYNLANVRHRLGDHSGAAEAVQKSLEIEPGDPDAWDNYASFLGFMEKWEEAEQAGRRALELDPHHANARMRLALILQKLGRDDFEPAETSRMATTKCASFKHPEFVLYYETPPVTPDAVQWMVDYLESAVERGERFKAGETVQIGWMITQLQDENGALCVCEPDFRSMPVNWVRSVSQTIVDLFNQQVVAQAAGLENEMDLPNWYQTGIACKRFGEDAASFNMQRAPGERESAQDSGWFCGCMFVDCDHESLENLRLASLYELATLNRQIVKFLALPHGCDLVVTADGVMLGRNGVPIKTMPRT